MFIIVGASGGLGSALVQELSKDNDVVATYRTHKPEILDTEHVHYAKLDVTNSADIARFIDENKSRFTKVNLINLAGVSLDGMAHKLTEEAWDTVLDTNLKGTFNVSRALLPLMREQQYGRIVNVSSVVGQIGVPGTAAYAASKAGLFGLARVLAAEGAAKNITVNTLALGYFEVGIIKTIPPAMIEKIVQTIPMKRLGDAANFVRAVKFIVDADYMTGSTININGGLFGN